MNAYLSVFASQFDGTPDMEHVLDVIKLYEQYDIATLESFEGYRTHVLENYFEDVEKVGQFIISFDATPAFKKFMKNIFEAQYYKAANDKWKNAQGDDLSIGILVQKAENQDMIKHGITSTFVVLRAMFRYEDISVILPLFMKRFAAKYKEFLRDVQEAIKGLLAFGHYTEMPSVL